MRLPTLGLGLSSNAQRTDSPRPYELLDAHPGAFDYLEYSAPLDVEQERREAVEVEADAGPPLLAKRGEGWGEGPTWAQ